MKRILKFMLWLLIILLLSLIFFVIYITLSDYKPPKQLDLTTQESKESLEVIDHDTLDLIIWNIGYGGLGAEMDFFYDGGKKVRPERELSAKYFKGILSFLQDESPDFWLLQEVDVRSKRTFGVNQLQEIEKSLSPMHAVFAMNYKVPFVPVPISSPMGRVKAGLATLSDKQPVEATRYAYPLIASWPQRLFLLDRCFILTRYGLSFSSGDLVIMNTHNSAYVYDSALRARELEIIKSEMLNQYAAGHYVIAGGDWNANPPGFEPSGTFNGHRFEASRVHMDPNLLPDGWTWAYDPNAPTNRNNDRAYQKGLNGTTCLDYFVVSPNVEIVDIRTIDLNFRDSDHNPVFLKVKLK